MSQSLKFVQEHLDEAAPTDVSEVFGAWQELVERLRAKVAARFELERDPSTEVLEDFGSRRRAPRPGAGLHRPRDRLDGALPHGERRPAASATCT